MNGFLTIAASAALFSLTSGYVAAESIVPVREDIDRLDGQRGAYPGVPTALMERRKMHGAGGDNFSENSVYAGGGDWPEGGFLSNLGIIAYHPFEGANTLHQCIVKGAKPWNYFTSLDVNCEGQSKPVRRRIIGYVYSHQHPGTSPLYRCRQDFEGRVDHFDSTRENCDGWGATINEGILGYIWAY